MKIIGVTEEMFERFCDRLTPMQRGVGGNMGARCFYLYAQDALIVLASDVSVGMLDDSEEIQMLRDLGVAVKKCATSPISVPDVFSQFPYKGDPPETLADELAEIGIELEPDEDEDDDAEGDDRYSDEALSALTNAGIKAKRCSSEYIRPEHILYGVALAARGLICKLSEPETWVRLIDKLESHTSPRNRVPGGDSDREVADPMMDGLSRAVLGWAELERERSGKTERVEVCHLLLAFLEAPADKWHPHASNFIADLMAHFGITRKKVLKAMEAVNESSQTV